MIRVCHAQVVANAIHVLMALQGERGLEMMLNHSIVISLLQRLREFNEWSQCLVLHVRISIITISSPHAVKTANPHTKIRARCVEAWL